MNRVVQSQLLKFIGEDGQKTKDKRHPGSHIEAAHCLKIYWISCISLWVSETDAHHGGTGVTNPMYLLLLLPYMLIYYAQLGMEVVKSNCHN